MSGALPHDLAAWRGQLRDLADYTIGTLGPWLTRLEQAVGPTVQRPLVGVGDPDGIDGLGSRGSWERLLATEWAIAEAAPMEFLRRASTGEQSFLRLATTTPSSGFDVAVLVDAGPFQFGAPRLVQLALLAVISRAAERSEARFRWGVIQEPGGPLFHGLGSDDVRRWLDRRSLQEATAEDLAHWQDRLELSEGSDDLWVIGGADVEKLNPRAAVIEDAVTPVGRFVDVSIHSPGGGAPRRVRLTLPSDRRCTRILREPFATGGRRSVGEAADPANPTALPFIFAPSGRRLVMRLHSGDAAAFHVPSSPRSEPGATRVLRAGDGERFVALGWHQRRFGGAVIDGDARIRIRGSDSQQSWHLPDVFQGDESLMRLMRGSDGALLLECPDGVLRRLDDDGSAVPVFDGVIGLGQSNGRVVVGAMTPGQPLKLYALGRGEADTQTLYTMPPSPLGHTPKLFFGHGGWQGPDNVELVAAEYAPGAWRVVQGRYRLDLEVSTGTRVVGVTRNLRFGAEPSLVIDDGRRLTLEGARDTWPLPRVGANVLAAGCNHADAQVAWLTDHDRLVVYSLEQQAVVLEADLRSLQTAKGPV